MKASMECKWARGSFGDDGDAQRLGCSDGHTTQHIL